MRLNGFGFSWRSSFDSISLQQRLPHSEHPTQQDDFIIFRQDQLIGLQYQSGERPLLLFVHVQLVVTQHHVIEVMSVPS
jgi:hypothetical protein